MKISVDKTIYDDTCIAKAVYALANRFSIQRQSISNHEEEWIIDCTDESRTKTLIINTLNDYKLRCIIEKETHDIRTILYAKAFSECDDVDESDLD